ncbi:MAG: tRNA (adenosine(37)-N6)-threonylcarbamoyltransferase complex ATPase subunit type 1 TsaE, partial [Rickettsiales bacterium]|nr:tRNA (adenosine(37)-N6)-threonylcarbamoyltransferase complex ATPase subunit type 1 TsaE [Rickettsiales bacterium]
RFFIQALTHQDTDVTSPTFTLLQQYDCPKGEIWHYDLYRLKHREESYELAMEDAFMHAITLIEWPAIIEPLLPSERLDITLKHDDGNSDKRLAILTIPDTLQALTNELSNE